MNVAISDAILRVLKRGPRKGLTAEQIAERTGKRLSSVRTIIAALKRSGDIEVVGTEPREFRPAQLYALRST